MVKLNDAWVKSCNFDLI